MDKLIQDNGQWKESIKKGTKVDYFIIKQVSSTIKANNHDNIFETNEIKNVVKNAKDKNLLDFSLSQIKTDKLKFYLYLGYWSCVEVINVNNSQIELLHLESKKTFSADLNSLLIAPYGLFSTEEHKWRNNLNIGDLVDYYESELQCCYLGEIKEVNGDDILVKFQNEAKGYVTEKINIFDVRLQRYLLMIYL